MKKISIVSIAIATALMVLLSACKKDEPDPEQEGKKFAKAFCDCLSLPQELQQMDCIVKLSNKYEKWIETEDEKFWYAFAFEFLMLGCEFPDWMDDDD